MKKLSLLALLLFSVGVVSAQSISVKSFRALPMDMTPSSKEGKRIDQNGQVAALIKVVTNETGFVFEGGTLGIVDTKQQVSEIWVWVPHASRKITIKHQRLGQLRDYRYPIEIESERTYEMVLDIQQQTQNIDPKERPKKQYLAFQITPPNAILEVNDQIWEVSNDGSAMKFVDFGTYSYRVYAKNYHTDAGNVTVNDYDQTHKVTVELKPNFGWIEVKGKDDLQGAIVYVDDTYIGKVPCKSEALESGTHTVRVVKEMYANYSQKVTVKDNETTSISPMLVADFAEVTLKVDADAEIWVNNEKKGVRSWTGRLGRGSYKIECKQSNHESTLTTQEITPSMTGNTLTLPAPKPIYGSLNVESSPNFAKLFIDGKDMGETPKFFGEILVGQHEVKVIKDGFADHTETITITKGEPKQLMVTLTNSKEIQFICNVPKAQLYVDNKAMGSASATYWLAYGAHRITASASNYSDYNGTILVSENSSAHYINMQPSAMQTQKAREKYEKGQANIKNGWLALLFVTELGMGTGLLASLGGAEASSAILGGTLGGIGVGLLIATPCWITGSVRKHKAKKMGYVALLDYEMPLNDSYALGMSLGATTCVDMPGMDGANTVPGVGLSLNF